MPADNPTEQFVEVDESDMVIGPVSRGVAHANPNKIHRAVFVLVTNDKNQMLLQKRSSKKDLYPGMWALSCAGHVKWGQDYREAAMAELQEELHIQPPLFLATNLLVKTQDETEQVQIFMSRVNQMPSNFDRDEIELLKWVDIDDLPDFVVENPLPPTDMQVLKLLMYIP